jgi:hypothetical protein
MGQAEPGDKVTTALLFYQAHGLIRRGTALDQRRILILSARGLFCYPPCHRFTRNS